MNGFTPAPTAVILESTVEADCPQVEVDELRENSEEIGAALRLLGYRTHILPFTFDTAAISRQLSDLAPSVVFNLVDSIEGKGNLISLAPMLLAHLKLPFTGASMAATTLTCDKLLTKQILRAHAITTPGWFTERQIMEAGAPLASPYIVKSITEHASFGIFADSIVGDTTTLQARLREKKSRHGGDWFAEAYIDGREFNLSLLAASDGTSARVLPPAEILFTSDFPAGQPRIVDYAAKWHVESAECIGTVRSFEFVPSDGALLEQLTHTALACWHAFELSGYARVDYRIAADGTPYVLEVNCNPFLSAGEGFGAAAAHAGIPFHQVIRSIVGDAYRLSHSPLPAMLAA